MRVIYKQEDKTILFEEENESICYIPNIGEAICFNKNPFDRNTFYEVVGKLIDIYKSDNSDNTYYIINIILRKIEN